MLTLTDRARGALLGLAVGDAVGTTLEFRYRGSFEPITDMVGGGPFHLKPGQWTDDTSMALCLASSLIEKGTLDLRDQMKRYVSWWQNGYLSSTGKCFDIGNATRAALQRWVRTGEPQSGDEAANTAGNGGLMRLAPVPIAYRHSVAKAVDAAAVATAGTHRAPECLQASRVFAEMLVRALNGYTKPQILCEPEAGGPLSGKLSAVVIGASYAKKPRNAIKGSGYVVESLEAALWAFHSTECFRDCILAAANLGDDADTTAAIAGQLAGAHYGESGIPSEWVARVYDGSMIGVMAEKLLAMSMRDEKTGEAA